MTESVRVQEQEQRVKLWSMSSWLANLVVLPETSGGVLSFKWFFKLMMRNDEEAESGLVVVNLYTLLI